jgi:putative colanic acid biosynthesis acetyltransferase WcaF
MSRLESTPPPDSYSGVRNDLFVPTGLDRGRSKSVEVLWYLVKLVFFMSGWPWPSRLRRALLIMFGAKVGKGLLTRPRLCIHFPWKLEIGDNCWIGEGCQILNLEPVVFEDNVALAHEVYVAAASHDIRSKTLAYANKPVRIKRGTWVATRAFIGPGVVIGENCVVGACAIVLKSVPDNSIVGSNLAQVIGERVLTNP